MRLTPWVVAVAGTLSLSACEGLRDAFSAQPDVVATVAGRRLTTDRLVSMMNTVPRGTVSSEGAEYLANLWVDLQLFARARVTGDLEPDSAAVERVMWPQLLQATLREWHDSLVSSRSPPTEASADSAYDVGGARLFQHILVPPAGTTSRDTAAARDKIGGFLARIRRGARFDEFTTENTDATRSDSGFLPVSPRGQFVGEFEAAAWALQPGQVSDVVQTSFGFHLIRRTPKEEARQRFLTHLQTAGQRSADSAYVAQLAEANGLKVEDDAAEVVKDALADPGAARRSSRRLITYRGGAFTVAELIRWLESPMFPPNASAQLVAQPDSVISGFARQLAEQELILRQADSAGITYPVADWQAIQLSYRATLDQAAAAIQLTDSVVADSTRPRQERLDSAASRVERFMDRLVLGQAQFRPLPPSLSGFLREGGTSYRLNQVGLNRAVELYTAQKRADSAAAAVGGDTTGAAVPGPIQPAPGPAPVPGGPPPPP